MKMVIEIFDLLKIVISHSYVSLPEGLVSGVINDNAVNYSKLVLIIYI